jgi:dihydrofolate reductase
MGKLAVDISMSLDGFVAGPDPTLERPLGDGGDRLHEWAFALESWRKPHGLPGGEINASTKVVEEALEATGAVVMGRRMFSGGEGRGKTTPTPRVGGETSLPSTCRCSCSPVMPARR